MHFREFSRCIPPEVLGQNPLQNHWVFSNRTRYVYFVLDSSELLYITVKFVCHYMSLHVCHYISLTKIVCHFTSLHEYVTICSTLCALPFWPHKLFCGVWQFRLEKIGEAYSLAHFVVFCFAVGLPEMNVFLSHVLSLRISLCRIQSLPLIGSCPAKGVKR